LRISTFRVAAELVILYSRFDTEARLVPSQLPRWLLTDCCDAPARAVRLAAHSEGQDSTGGGSAPQARNFPPPPVVSPIEGLIDTHFHSGPDVFGRSLDDEQGARLCRDHGMEAVVLKNHVATTADRAWFARKHVTGLQVFGGISLNAAAGGINPDAVEWMWRMQGGYGRCVWFPTIDADHHVRHFRDAPEGIQVLAPNGAVLPAVRQVLKICARQKLVVNTGHLSPQEALAVVAAAREQGADRIIVTHAQFEVVNMSQDEMRQAAAMGAKLELCACGPLMGPQAHLPWMRAWRQVRVQESAEAIRALGAEHFVLGTDLGQSGNPSHADGLQMFVAELLGLGISKDQIRTMGRENPARLLMG
jgi:hypothetical protein